MSTSHLCIGLMSGTSLDGVDGVLAIFPPAGKHDPIRTVATAFLPFPGSLRAELMALQAPGDDEIHREALAANALARVYAECVSLLLAKAAIKPDEVHAIGAHGQTVRHRPECGYTRQTNNPALLAELTGIDVVADFRSRDIAAGGQGAPLVPAFHQAIFGGTNETRVVANIGGIGNISILAANGAATGFDTGPGNVLMDMWIARHRGAAYDADGTWAASGRVIPHLLAELRSDPFFALPPPKSTGRDLFHSGWLDSKLAAFPDASPVDVQATLAALTATTLADAVSDYAHGATVVYVCGGGTYNRHLMALLQQTFAAAGRTVTVDSTQALGVAPNHVEALAFAWLAYRHLAREAGNLPAVTGAKDARILGALYPA